MLTGAYLLLLHLDRPREVAVGALGTLPFDAATYVYVGSAMGGLEQRVARHLRDDKRPRWHIDRLLAAADRAEALLLPSPVRVECELAALVATLPDTAAVRGFGCSDCRCEAHLFRVSERSAACLRAAFPAHLRRERT